jgi:hypothetical protein
MRFFGPNDVSLFIASCPVRLVASCFPRFSNAWRVFLDINEVIKLIVKV